MSKNKVSRREFLSLATQMGVAASLAGKVYAKQAWSSPAQVEEALRPLIDCSIQQGPVYEGEHLEHIGFPLGGIGTGSIALTGQAELAEWQIFNQVHKPARIGQTFFALSGKAGTQSFTRVLQTKPASESPDLSPMKSLRFRGEFPIAWVEFEDDIPVAVSLEAFSPMIPLEPEKSAYPMAVFTWKLKNKSAGAVSGHLLASLQNAVGHDGFAKVEGHRFVGYGMNRAKESKGKGTVHLAFDALPGKAGRFEGATALATNASAVSQAMSTVENCKVHFDRGWQNGFIPLSESVLKDGVQAVWMGAVNGPALNDPSSLMAIAKAVEAGTNLVIMGGEHSLAEALLHLPVAEEGSILIADFDGEQYAPGWQIEGEAFGTAPAKGTFSNQSPVSGYLGLGLVNSYNSNDDLKGKLVSPEFNLSKPFLQFLIGGGNRTETEIRLIVEGVMVRKASGWNNEFLHREVWDVAEFRDKKAHLEIVDEGTGGWGHINVDDIRLSDHRMVGVTREEAEYLQRLLPFTADRIRPDGPTHLGGLLQHPFYSKVKPGLLQNVARGTLETLKLKEGAELIDSDHPESPAGIAGSHGKGRVLFLNFPLENVHPGDIDRLVGGTLEYLTQQKYTPRTGWPEDSPYSGSMALGCFSGNAASLPVWTGSKHLTSFLEGGAPNPSSQESLTRIGESFAGALRVPYNLKPGEETEETFVLSWHFPNHYYNSVYRPTHLIGNEYSNRFKDASKVFLSFAQNREELSGLTHLFHDTFYRSTLPVALLDCVGSQASILKSQTSMWLADGTFAGWEGVVGDQGCCPMNCTHVYNYAHAMACLYPQLERAVRIKDLGIQLNEEGIVHHRLTLPLTEPRGSGEALDGQLGTLLKLYREYRRCPDDSFLKQWWEPAKKALAYVFKAHDPNAEGIIRNRQFNTYDDAVYELNSFIGTLYLAALRAMEEMAGRVGDASLAADCRSRFEKGRATVADQCWDGEYFMQPADPNSIEGRNYGKGCLSDQVVGQWWAHILKLGYLLPEEKIKTALANVLKYNWRERMEGHKQEPRVYADPDDSGLLICTWPKGERPKVPILYNDEVWTGMEYQVASHLLFEGMTDRAVDIVTKVRKRSDGRLRKGTHPSGVGNPWNEIECGDHYARAMSSYALLLAAQGQDYEGPSNSLGFHPILDQDRHASFFTAAEGWGTFEQLREGTHQKNSISLAHGNLPLSRASFSLPEGVGSVAEATLSVGGETIPSGHTSEAGKIHFNLPQPLILTPGDKLIAELTWNA
jgi:uncharacterized protein (DUF608 family)